MEHKPEPRGVEHLELKYVFNEPTFKHVPEEDFNPQIALNFLYQQVPQSEKSSRIVNKGDNQFDLDKALAELSELRNQVGYIEQQLIKRYGVRPSTYV